jgi:hypothetical protein
VDAMNLLERIAFEGIRLPTSLVMFRKALFTLDGILHDIGAPEFSIESVISRHLLQNWLTNWRSLGLPLTLADWVGLQCSALLFPGRLLLQGAQNLLQRGTTPAPTAVQMKTRRKRLAVTRPQSSGGEAKQLRMPQPNDDLASSAI